jgi:hypothetical protein
MAGIAGRQPEWCWYPTLRFSMVCTLRASLIALPLLSLLSTPALAQSERFMLSPGSTVGPDTRVEPRNCVTDPRTGAITCDTTIKNPPGSTPARPVVQPFSN